MSESSAINSNNVAALSPAPDGGKATRIRDMFATIVPRYDLVNTLMTLGLDRRWRRATVAMAEPAGAIALDIATGTGELAFELAHAGAQRIIAVDFCHEMIEAAIRKRHVSRADGEV